VSSNRPLNDHDFVREQLDAKHLPDETGMNLRQPLYALTYASNIYGVYCVPTVFSERVVPRTLLQGKVYEPETILFLRNIVGAGDMVTAGVFIGDFLPGISRAMAKDSLIWGFEPHPISVAAAECTVGLNRLENVRLIPKALSDKPGEKVLHAVDKNTGEQKAAASRIIADQAYEDDAATPRILATTIDRTVPIERCVTAIHLDLEGHEIPALLGARRTLKRWRPVLILEKNLEEEWFSVNFPNLQYRRAGKIDRNAVFVSERAHAA
jgi:FkbM family methyltransferase